MQRLLPTHMPQLVGVARVGNPTSRQNAGRLYILFWKKSLALNKLLIDFRLKVFIGLAINLSTASFVLIAGEEDSCSKIVGSSLNNAEKDMEKLIPGVLCRGKGSFLNDQSISMIAQYLAIGKEIRSWAMININAS